MANMTKDERYLLAAYKEAVRLGDEQAVLSKLHIASLIGMGARSVENIINQLARANFIRKESKDEFYLSNLGIELAKSLIRG